MATESVDRVKAALNAHLSPALMARTVDPNHWEMARHLAVIDRAITDLVVHHPGEYILIIQAPPRHGKSQLVSKWLPAWFVGCNPGRHVILTSYGADFARTWGKRAKDLLETHGRQCFGVTLSQDQHAASDWETSEGGGMMTAGVGGPILGRGADLFIMDDPLKNAEEAISEQKRESQWEWWQSTAMTRVEPGGSVIVTAQRWHNDDLIGRLIKEAESGEGRPVKVIDLPALALDEDDPLGRGPGEALWPERWPKEVRDDEGRLIGGLELKRLSTDVYWWQSQYQQRPGKHGRTEWPNSYFMDLWADPDEWPDTFEALAFATDPSKGKTDKSDPAAIVCAGLARGLIWVDTIIGRMPSEQIVERGIDLFLSYSAKSLPMFGVEANAFQDLLAPMYQARCEERGIPPLPMVLIHNTINKELRISRLGPYLMNHKIRLLPTASNRTLFQQLSEWPLAAHDDGPDALEMALRMLNQWEMVREAAAEQPGESVQEIEV